MIRQIFVGQRFHIGRHRLPHFRNLLEYFAPEEGGKKFEGHSFAGQTVIVHHRMHHQREHGALHQQTHLLGIVRNGGQHSIENGQHGRAELVGVTALHRQEIRYDAIEDHGGRRWLTVQHARDERFGDELLIRYPFELRQPLDDQIVEDFHEMRVRLIVELLNAADDEVPDFQHGLNVRQFLLFTH